MAISALIFGTDDLYPKLKPFYDLEVKRGNMEIVGHAVFENGNIRFYSQSSRGGVLVFQIAIISSKNNFYQRMKWLEAQKVPRKNIIDGSIFKTLNFDFPRFLREGVVYGKFLNPFEINHYSIYPTVSQIENCSIIKCGMKSYIEGGVVTGFGHMDIGKFTSIATGTAFRMSENGGHNYHNISNYAPQHLNWNFSIKDFPITGVCRIEIGNDVWIGRGSILKTTNSNKPLKIGDGAVIASDSVVVKNVPPYAIVGGNPARLIKYRFPEDIIEALLRIKWWNWSLDKIYENFKYFNRIEEFISIHDIRG